MFRNKLLHIVLTCCVLTLSSALHEPVCDDPYDATCGNVCSSSYGSVVKVIHQTADIPSDPIIYGIAFDDDAGREVSFRVQNPFGSDADTYIRYKKKISIYAMDPACNSMLDLVPGCHLESPEITVGCIDHPGMANYAVVDVYFATTDTNGFIPDNADPGTKVEKCCHPRNVGAQSVIQYSFTIQCACPDGPAVNPTANPAANPTDNPTSNPTANPAANPTDNPTANPTANPVAGPTDNPTSNPTANPVAGPTDNPTSNPTANPVAGPTDNPTSNPTANPVANPTDNPTSNPTANPVANPTDNPTSNPTSNPTANPTANPTIDPNATPNPAQIDLASAGRFVILSKSGVTQTSTVLLPSIIIGDVGTSPIAATALTGFALVKNPADPSSTSGLVTGDVYAADYPPPTPIMLGTAIVEMEAAYVTAAGLPFPIETELGAGTISNMVLERGIYKWSTGTVIAPNTKLTFHGSETDVWVMQIAGVMLVGVSAEVLLTGGAKAENIFWAVAGGATLNPGSHTEGVILSMTTVKMLTGSSLNGAAYAQTAVILDTNTVILKTAW